MRPIDADKLREKIEIECNPYGKPSIGYDDGIKVLKIIAQAPTITTKDKLLTVIGNEIKELRHDECCRTTFSFRYASGCLEGVCKLIGDSELLDKEYERVRKEKEQ